MLKYFFEQTQINEVNYIIQVLNKKKERLKKLDFEYPFIEYDEVENKFEIIKGLALKKQNEKLANAQFVAKTYLNLFCNLASYFRLLNLKKYKESWSQIQNCLDNTIEIGKFTDIQNRYEVNDIKGLLRMYESLYPYNIFCSSEYVISDSKCSICGNSMNSMECPHICGNLYWGEKASEDITEIKGFNAVAVVTNPVNKRCIIELVNDERTEIQKFFKLDEFLQHKLYPFQMFNVKERKVMKQREDIKKVGRNEECSCKSGKKFKKCCGKDLYYEHYIYTILPKKTIQFFTEY